jgi:pimeloyl-ACP methyl ester carboxylesterase
VRSREVEAAGARLTVREWGAEDGAPFLFWHSVGPGGTGAVLDVAAGPLAAGGLRVIAPDAPGFGSSPARANEAYALERLAELVWEIADATNAAEPILAGHSWGGAVAVAAAGIRPERTRALVLYDSGHCDYADWPGADLTVTLEQMVERASQDTELESWDRLVEELRAEHLDQPWTLDAWREAVVVRDDGRVALRCDPRARGAAYYHLTYDRPSDWWPQIAAAGIPVLLLLATEPDDVREANERLVPRFAEAVPQVEIVRPSGCRHQVFADLGADAGELVSDWRRRAAAASG